MISAEDAPEERGVYARAEAFFFMESGGEGRGLLPLSPSLLVWGGDAMR